MSDPQPLDYSPPPRRLRLRRWLLRGCAVILVLLIALGLVYRGELRDQWDAGWKRYHTWRAERAFAAILVQDHGVPFGTVVYDSAKTDPVLQLAPHAVRVYERHQALMQGKAPAPLPADRAVVLAGQVREPAANITADVSVALADGGAITIGRALIWKSEVRSLVPRGSGYLQDQYEIVGEPVRRLAFSMGKVTERPFEIVIPYVLDGDAGEIRGWLDANPGSGGGSNYTPPPSVRLIATHGWMVNNVSFLFDNQQKGAWHLSGPERRLRGYIPEWTLHDTDWKRGGAITYTHDGRLRYWEAAHPRGAGRGGGRRPHPRTTALLHDPQAGCG